MRIEYENLKEEPGMARSATIIPEDLEFRPECPCPTRSCFNHGFCTYCISHHNDINEKLKSQGKQGHGPYCVQMKDIPVGERG